MSPLHEDVPRVALERREALQVAGVGQGIEVHHRFVAGGNPVEYEVGADEAGAACNQESWGGKVVRTECTDCCGRF
jgi:hypothetical protein